VQAHCTHTQLHSCTLPLADIAHRLSTLPRVPFSTPPSSYRFASKASRVGPVSPGRSSSARSKASVILGSPVSCSTLVRIRTGTAHTASAVPGLDQGYVPALALVTLEEGAFLFRQPPTPGSLPPLGHPPWFLPPPSRLPTHPPVVHRLALISSHSLSPPCYSLTRTPSVSLLPIHRFLSFPSCSSNPLVCFHPIPHAPDSRQHLSKGLSFSRCLFCLVLPRPTHAVSALSALPILPPGSQVHQPVNYPVVPALGRFPLENHPESGSHDQLHRPAITQRRLHNSPGSILSYLSTGQLSKRRRGEALLIHIPSPSLLISSLVPAESRVNLTHLPHHLTSLNPTLAEVSFLVLLPEATIIPRALFI
jgi:hypothetical protein